MKLILFIVCSLHCFQGFSQTDTIQLKVDVLGKYYPYNTYHHPINGRYTVNLNTIYELNSKQKNYFFNFIYVDPSQRIKDQRKNSSDHNKPMVRGRYYNAATPPIIQANSLRHYIDLSELVYINWAMGTVDSNTVKLEAFKDSAKIMRTKYQQTVQNYLNPFFIRRHEVTNAEYKQFVEWVKDSMMKEILFKTYPNFDTALQFLDIPQKATITDTNRTALRQKYHLDFDFDFTASKSYHHMFAILLEHFYIQPEERYFFRHQLNWNTLTYHYTKNGQTVSIPVYPDTSCWLGSMPSSFNDPMANMYFWHNAYDYHPVNNINYYQAEAFCHWEEQQLKNDPVYATLPFDIEVSLPSVMHYEHSVVMASPAIEAYRIEDRQIVTNLWLEYNTNKKIEQFVDDIRYPLKVYLPEKFDRKHAPKKRRHTIEHYGFDRLYYNEVNRIDFLSNNVSEWMTENYTDHYVELIKAYINYNCFASITYCETQRLVDEQLIRSNHKDGQLILGSNWYDERYENVNNINVGGIYPKTFKGKSNQYPTVGFRYVIKVIPKETTSD